MSKAPEAFRTISEAAAILGVPAHVLRFWESRFTQIRPVKRAGGRRYYRQEDLRLLDGIRRLLHGDGMTIRGVQKLLREEGVAHVAALGAPELERGEPGPEGAAPPAREDDEAPARDLAGDWQGELSLDARDGRPWQPPGPGADEAPMAEDVPPEAAPAGRVLPFTPRFAHRGTGPAAPQRAADAPAAASPEAAHAPGPHPAPPSLPSLPSGATGAAAAAPPPVAEADAPLPAAPATPASAAAAARAARLRALEQRLAALPPDPADDEASLAAPALDLARLLRDPAVLQPLIARLLELRQRMDAPTGGRGP